MMLAAGAGGAGRGLSPALRVVVAGVGTAVVLAVLVFAVVTFLRREWGAFFVCVVAAAAVGYAAWFPDVLMHSLVWIGRQA